MCILSELPLKRESRRADGPRSPVGSQVVLRRAREAPRRLLFEVSGLACSWYYPLARRLSLEYREVGAGGGCFAGADFVCKELELLSLKRAQTGPRSTQGVCVRMRRRRLVKPSRTDILPSPHFLFLTVVTTIVQDQKEWFFYFLSFLASILA